MISIKDFRLPRSFFLSIVFFILFDLPVAFFQKSQGMIKGNFAQELIIVFSATVIFFSLISLSKHLSKFLVILLFAIGSLADYYLLAFKKIIDGGLLVDLLSIDLDLIMDYVSVYAPIGFILGGYLGFTLYKINITTKLPKIIACFVLVSFITTCFVNGKSKISKGAFLSYKDYLPFNLFYSARYFIKVHRSGLKVLKNQRDLTKEYSFKLSEDQKEPLIVVLIIGESMRGDLIELNNSKYHNMPLLSQRKNIISFPHATSSATSTRVALPYMLTSAVAPNFDSALGELSITSIFKHLGFHTSWIGTQGIFGGHESTFASMALEPEFSLTKHEIRRALADIRLDDGNLVPFISKRLHDVSTNHFLVVHLIGSHWAFTSRYPKSFKEGFTPSCSSLSPADCSEQELFNSYHNTILYTDYVLDQIIQLLEHKNALIIYSSDHGFSLGERGIFGNAYSGDNVPFEQLSIGFFTWGSDKFIKNYHNNYDEIMKKQQKPVSHDYIFHSLLDCINIKSPFIQKGLSLCGK